MYTTALLTPSDFACLRFEVFWWSNLIYSASFWTHLHATNNITMQIIYCWFMHGILWTFYNASSSDHHWKSVCIGILALVFVFSYDSLGFADSVFPLLLLIDCYHLIFGILMWSVSTIPGPFCHLFSSCMPSDPRQLKIEHEMNWLVDGLGAPLYVDQFSPRAHIRLQ